MAGIERLQCEKLPAVSRAADRARSAAAGWPTVRAIVFDRLAPGLLDGYLGWKGVAAHTDR
jgi:hypothetical protein